MSNRFTRDYRLTIGVGASKVVIEPPFNISFSATESILNRSLNKLNIKIPGVTRSTGQRLIKYELDQSIYLPIEFLIGYKGNLFRAFKGSVRTGELSREGPVLVNTLECYDGHPDFNEAYTSRVVTGKDLAIDALLSDMPNTERGAITALTNTLRPRVLVGSSSALLDEISENNEFFIKDEKLFMLGENEVTSLIIPTVSSETGLKSVPQQDHIDTTFTTKLNPALKIGGLCRIVSEINPAVNGVYKIYQSAPSGSYKTTWDQVVTCRKANAYKAIR